MVKKILWLEGLLIFLLCLYFYFIQGGNILLLIVLFLLPDLSMVGYLKNPVIGSKIYNAIHNHALGILLIFLGIFLNLHFLILFGIVLSAHVGLDRACGFGLKLPSGFKDTSLGKIGK